MPALLSDHECVKFVSVTTARYPDVAVRLREVPPDQPGRTLDLLARMLDLTDEQLHERCGRALSRSVISHKRSGRSPVLARDLWPLADALGAEVDVLLLPPSMAAQWLVDHRSAELDGAGAKSKKGAPAETGADQGEPRTITHRRNGFP